VLSDEQGPVSLCADELLDEEDPVDDEDEVEGLLLLEDDQPELEELLPDEELPDDELELEEELLETGTPELLDEELQEVEPPEELEELLEDDVPPEELELLSHPLDGIGYHPSKTTCLSHESQEPRLSAL